MASGQYSAIGQNNGQGISPTSDSESQQSIPQRNEENRRNQRQPSSGKRRRRRSASRAGRLSWWEKVKEPILECSRCGERYFVPWTEDRRCPKCGRRPPKIQAWQLALSALLPPAAIFVAMFHKKTSPRNGAITFGVGLLGAALETALYIMLTGA